MEDFEILVGKDYFTTSAVPGLDKESMTVLRQKMEGNMEWGYEKVDEIFSYFGNPQEGGVRVHGYYDSVFESWILEVTRIYPYG